MAWGFWCVGIISGLSSKWSSFGCNKTPRSNTAISCPCRCKLQWCYAGPTFSLHYLSGVFVVWHSHSFFFCLHAYQWDIFMLSHNMLLFIVMVYEWSQFILNTAGIGEYLGIVCVYVHVHLKTCMHAFLSMYTPLFFTAFSFSVFALLVNGNMYMYYDFLCFHIV